MEFHHSRQCFHHSYGSSNLHPHYRYHEMHRCETIIKQRCPQHLKNSSEKAFNGLLAVFFTHRGVASLLHEAGRPPRMPYLKNRTYQSFGSGCPMHRVSIGRLHTLNIPQTCPKHTCSILLSAMQVLSM